MVSDYITKRLIVDNCIREEYLFGHTKQLTPYHSKLICYQDGQKVSLEMDLTSSCIAESEQAMVYWIDELHEGQP